MKRITRCLNATFGALVGTLIYTRFMSGAHEFDWTRAIFIGLVTGVFSLIWYSKKPA